MLTLEPMPYADLPQAYRSMKTEFPDNERKPLEMLQKQYNAGISWRFWTTSPCWTKGRATAAPVWRS